MQFGQIVLLCTAVLIWFEVLDLPGKLLRIHRGIAGAMLAAMSLGGFWSIAVGTGRLGAGGLLVPLLLGIVLLFRRPWRTVGRSMFCLLFSATGGYLACRFLPLFMLGEVGGACGLGLICAVLSFSLGKYTESVLFSALLSVQTAYLLTALEAALWGGYVMINSGIGAEYDAMATALLCSAVFCRLAVAWSGRSKRDTAMLNP